MRCHRVECFKVFHGESEYIIFSEREERIIQVIIMICGHILSFSVVIRRGVRAAGAIYILPCEKTPKPLDSSNRVSCHPAREENIVSYGSCHI